MGLLVLSLAEGPIPSKLIFVFVSVLSRIATGNSLTVNGQSDPLYLFVEGTALQFGGIQGTTMEFNVIDLGAVAGGTTFVLERGAFPDLAPPVWTTLPSLSHRPVAPHC